MSSHAKRFKGTGDADSSPKGVTAKPSTARAKKPARKMMPKDVGAKSR